jgi:rubrerythrin
MPFTPDTVFDIAQQIERNGRRYYRRAAELCGDRAAGVVFLELAAMEANHERAFATMRADAEREHPNWLAEPFLDDRPELAEPLAAGRVFDFDADPAAGLGEATPVRDVIERAIGLEQDSIIFYLLIRQAVPPDWGHDRIDAVIAEELGHITVLGNRLAEQMA